MLDNFWLKKINNKKILEIKRLKGGVSCEVYKAKTIKDIYCIKRALPKLLVKKDWYVKTNRIKYEYLWLKHCKKLLPKNIPKIYKFDEKSKYLILEYLNEKKFLNLKSEFLKGKINHQLINKISKNLSFIHNNSMKKNIEKNFSPNFRNFYDLRLDAYFNEVKRGHSNLSSFVNNIIKQYKENRITLVHGDMSPKNILFYKNEIKFLDAETSNFGDPVFDVVFFTNHLLIKSIYLPNKKNQFLKAYKNFIDTYISNSNCEDKKFFFRRCLNMIPLMLIARVDGKSPVEYVTSVKMKNEIRKLSFKLLNKKDISLGNLLNICSNG